MNVSAIIVTRGDQDLWSVLSTLPDMWEIIVWDNGMLERQLHHPQFHHMRTCLPFANDLGAYGRYAAIEHASGELIYFQDDDCIVSDFDLLLRSYEPGVLSALMPASRDDYSDTVLVGWGALFDRALPERAFERWRAAGEETESEDFRIVGADFVFPMLTPHKRIDAEHEDLPWAHAENRTWRRPGYHSVKQRYLDRAREIRDGDSL